MRRVNASCNDVYDRPPPKFTHRSACALLPTVHVRRPPHRPPPRPLAVSLILMRDLGDEDKPKWVTKWVLQCPGRSVTYK